MGGEVRVLGIISVSITLHVSLGYKVAEVRGQATLVIEPGNNRLDFFIETKVTRAQACDLTYGSAKSWRATCWSRWHSHACPALILRPSLMNLQE